MRAVFTAFVLLTLACTVRAEGPVLPDTIAGDTRASVGEWNEVYASPKGKLAASKRYRLEFRYKIAEMVSNAYLYVLYRSAKETELRPYSWKSYCTLEGVAGETGTIRKKVVLGPYDDYQLIFAIHGKGKVTMDDARLSELRRIDLTAGHTSVAKEPEPYEPYAMCFQLTPWNYKSDGEIKRAIAMMDAAGVQWVRLGAPWFLVEPHKGEINQEYLRTLDLALGELQRRGMHVYMQFLATPAWASTNPKDPNYPAYMPTSLEDYRAYVRFVVSRYKDRVKYWEVWNEWDWTFWESSLPDFAALLKASYEEAKKIDPSCKVVLGGMSTDGVHTWDSPKADRNALQRLYDLGGGKHFDIVAIHPYASDLNTGIMDSIDKINAAYSIMKRNGDAAKRIWITEIGWATDRSPQSDQAKYLKQVYTQLIKHPMIDKIFWYNFRCTGTDPKDQEQNFGIVNHDFSERPAYEAYRALEKAKKRVVNDEMREIDP